MATEHALYLTEQLGHYTVRHGSTYVAVFNEDDLPIFGVLVNPETGHSREWALTQARERAYAAEQRRIEREQWRAMHGE